ncbi:hypothetical protein IM660_01390 [Ruania alkalisoli]|uniref:AMIN-like domain-containing protein n=1 Tax=Ruania alkalisoli TaxID=2779775 RepID=A0A7M1STT4_9MICO|nr:hypothetical protein [Ruania alkalisoli]QOR70999.1 hypothetical protein IM660_01390 [Ruania alkalisoli]
MWGRPKGIGTRGVGLVASAAAAALVAGCTGSDDSSPSAGTGTSSAAPTTASEPDASGAPGESSEPAEPESADPRTPSPTPDDSNSGCSGELTYADDWDWSLPRPEPGDFVPYDYASQIQEHSESAYELTVVRTAEHDGFDRFVAEYTNPHGYTDEPGLYAAYVECAGAEGSGEEIPITGEDILAVSIIGGTPRFSDDAETPEVDPSGVAITDIDYQEQTGGAHGLYLGVGHERADFRVFSLTDPYRVVVDIAHPD